ncbi:hypothetical protein M3Y98_00305000 [Aphelenchoides besseyi]|nr:hypothetical protein M3Y98_00305000 [Aphelenchoides besseyi]KAI6201262.1 hypothetical protein M3Y96_00823100 [Aphelenchoides besseyi]
MFVIQLAEWLSPTPEPSSQLRIRYNQASTAISNSFTLQISKSDAAYLYVRYKTIERTLHWCDYFKQPMLIIASLNLSRFTYAQLMEQYITKVRELGVFIDQSVDGHQKRGGFAKGPSKMIYPLHYAADIGNLESVQKLLEKRVDINQIDDEGQTALHYAATNGHVEVVRYLLDAGIDRSIRCDLGMTALDSCHDIKIIQMLQAD